MSTVYPNALDTDAEIQQIDDNITELGSDVINSLRSAVFALEEELGIGARGSMGSTADRLDVSLNANGTIKASALTSVGLATLPITNNQIADGTIEEYKINFSYSPSDLHSLILSDEAAIAVLQAFSNTLLADLNFHVEGAEFFSDGVSQARHVLSQIDINSVPSDSRDLGFTWVGLKDKNGVLRSATQAAQALQQINDDLTDHENSIINAHPATAIIVDTTNFQEIPVLATNAQEVFDYLDDAEVLNMGEHRATQHAQGIPRIARAQSPLLPDGYRENVVSPTLATSYLVHTPNTTPVDNLSTGDDIIKFNPDNNANFQFDAQFSQVKIGDIVRINYGNGTEASFPVESIRYIPGIEWFVRINGINLFDSGDGYALARIDRSLADSNTYGVCAIAAANARDDSGPIYTDILSSIIVGSPRGASALGLSFDPNQINSTHYLLYLELYPSGNPEDHIISLPGIDVSGDAGLSPGSYTLDSVVQTTNDKLREIGYNFRLIAYSWGGQFGIMMADAINNASFAIISGINTSGTLLTGGFVNNVIGGNSLDDFDALGFGSAKANLASPAFQSSWIDTTAAQLPTKVLVPLRHRNYIVNGIKRDNFADTYLATDGYWDGYISARTPVGISTVEVTYTVLLDLRAAELRPGKTLVIQPTVDFTNPLYNNVDYGRFIIKSVNFLGCLPGDVSQTDITVINGLHAAGTGFGFSSNPALPVKVYFSEDSVHFDSQNLIDSGSTSVDFSRFHEILVSAKGETFSHERGRMPRQTETVELLGTTNWHIRKISPKLRGYRDSDPLVFNKFVRFYVLDYDSSSGEFDGYLGQRSETTLNIFKTGPISTGRKNVPVRFYDETGIDFIEMVYQDSDASPGSNILSTAVPRYVDIELYPSYELLDEYLLLGTCEVNWDPTSGTDIIQYVQDSRPFGSIDETDFTESALEFISAGDKYLHSNGVIRGLDLDLVGTDGEIFFKGGVALVNGRIVTANQGSVTIPQVYDVDGGSLPQDITWAVCLDQNGNLIPIIITSSKDQFFGTTGSGSYYLPSATFLELTNVRVDLTPISLITATIASITISDTTDIRKFVVHQDATAPLIWSDNNQIIGNFYSFEALRAWLINSNSTKNIVRVRGTFELLNTDSAFDLTGLTTPTIFEGEGAVFNVAAACCFKLGSNITLKNIVFNYSGEGAAVSKTSLINGDTACLLADAGSDLSDVAIEACTFFSARSSQRPPFILFNLQNGQIDKNINILNNKFNESNASDYLGESQAAVVFKTNNTGVSTDPATLLNCFIEKNYCSHKQGIYLTTAASPAATIPGLAVYQTSISNNSCGIIGFLISGVENTLPEITQADRSTGLWIHQNTCNFIGNLYDSGEILVGAGDLNYGHGSFEISNNKINWLALQVQNISASNQYSQTSIINNHFTAFDSTYLDLFSPSLGNDALIIFEASDTDSTEVLIEGNKFGFGRYDGTTYGYDRGIVATVSAIISKNSIRGLNASGRGIYTAGFVGSATRRVIIEGNKIYRGAVSITNFIVVPSTNTHEGVVKNNYFDSYTIDGSSVATINNYPNNWAIKENKNQVAVATLAGACGNPTISPTNSLIPAPTGTLNSFISTNSIDQFQCNYVTGDNSVLFKWIIPLLDVLPDGVILSKLSFTYSASAQDGNDSIQTIVIDGAGTTITSTSETIIATGDQAVSYTFSPVGYIRRGPSGTAGSTPYVIINTTVNNASSLTVILKNLQLEFRW